MTQVSKVSRCNVTECGFNRDRACHAAAIQVGDPPVAERRATDPKCDTFVADSGHRFGAQDLKAQVGACMMADCTHNQDLCCTADGITVDHHQGHADCRTYQKRG